MIPIEKLEKITTNFAPSNKGDVINEANLDGNFLKLNGQITLSEIFFNKVKLHYNKPSVEESLSRRAIYTTTPIFFVKRLFDNFQNADKVLKGFFNQKTYT